MRAARKPTSTLDLVVMVHPAGMPPPPHPHAALWHPDPAVDLVTIPLHSLELGSEARIAVEEGLFAAVAVPDETPEALDVLDCTCLPKRAHEILIPESLWLQALAGELVARYRAWCHPLEEG